MSVHCKSRTSTQWCRRRYIQAYRFIRPSNPLSHMGVIRRICASMGLSLCVFTACVYFTFFHHPPADVILSNQAGQPENLSPDRFILDPSKPHSIAEIADVAWAKWLYDNKYVSIGDVYDSKCDAEDKILVGKVILFADKDTEELKARLYLNTTFDTVSVYGSIAVVAYYNGKELYNNNIDMCTAEKEHEVKVLKCPLTKGPHYIVKELKVPPLLPKGEYSVVAAVTNQDKLTIMCTQVGFRL